MLKSIKDPFKLKFIGRMLNLLSGGMYRDVEEFKAWKFLGKSFDLAVVEHQMHIAFVCGEGSVFVYGSEELNVLFNFVRPNFRRKEPRLKIVVGPIINVHPETYKSILIELFRSGLADLYASEIRQPQHFRINGFYTGKRDYKKEKPSTVFIEGQHSCLDNPFSRLKNSRFLEYSSKNENEILLWLETFHRICQRDCNKLQDLSDINDHLISLTTDEIVTIGPSLMEASSDMAYPFRKEDVLQAMKKHGINQRFYL